MAFTFVLPELQIPEHGGSSLRARAATALPPNYGL